MQVPSPGNNKELGKEKWDPFLLKSQGPCFSSQSPVTLSAALCSAVCSDIGLGNSCPLEGAAVSQISQGDTGNHLPNGVLDVGQCDHCSSQSALLTVSHCFNRWVLHFGGRVPILGMGLAGEFEGGQYTASLPVNCQNIFCFFSDFSTTLWVKSKSLSSQWGFSHGFKEADLLCEDKLELHFAKLHMTKIHCSFTAALIINMPHFALFPVTPLRFYLTYLLLI